MSTHDHREYVEGCFRCDLSRAECDGETCMVPECDQPAVELLANDAPCLSPHYAERWVCRWHRGNPFPTPAEDAPSDPHLPSTSGAEGGS